MDQNINEDIILIDWFSFTVKDLSPDEVKNIIGLQNINWSLGSGARGYKDRYYFNGISIHFNGSINMGVWVEMSGSGCRAFEDFSILSWRELFDFCLLEKAVHITRLDIAFDDHSGIFPIQDIMDDTRLGNYISPSSWWEVVYSSKGSSLYIGSPKSLIRFRIYDKASERGLLDSHWIRFEMQLRDERANLFLAISDDIEYNFFSVINNYLRYVSPSLDLNKSRWPLTSYWDSFIKKVPKTSLFLNLGSEYNMDHIYDNVFERWGNAVDAVLQTMDTVEFKDRLKNRHVNKNPKYDLAVKEYKERTSVFNEK